MAARKKATRKKAPSRKAAPRPKSNIQKKKGPGRYPFKPTDEQRVQVKILVGMGLTYDELSHVILNPKTGKGISTRTLQKHFQEELGAGTAFVKSRVVQSLLRKAISDNHPQSATCSIFYLKCKGGWRQEDKLIHEVQSATGVLIAPAGISPEDWIDKVTKLNEGKEPPKDDR